MKDYIAEAEIRKEEAQVYVYEQNLRERAVVAAERQAAALELLCVRMENIEKWLYNLHSQEWDSRAALERIAAVLEKVQGRAYIDGEGFVDCLFVSPPRV